MPELIRSTRPWPKEKWLWILFIAEALLFWSFYVREIAPYPPQNYDQAVYLTQTYTLQEQVLTNGLAELWRELWKNDHASSLAFPIEGAFFGLVLGGTRLPQLCVLFVAFCALQIFAFTNAQKAFGDRVYGWITLGLILSQSTLWFWAGGLFDFRLDFLAYSLYGIWCCAVLRSALFADRRWCIGCGLIGALLVLHRFLTVLYVAGVCTGFAIFCGLVWLLNRRHLDLVDQMKRRLLNLALMLAVLAAIVGPILFLNWGTIYSKYGYAQFVYEKDIRAREFGVFNLTDNLLFYPRSIVRDHFGPTFLWASGIGLAGALLAYLLSRWTRAVQPIQNRNNQRFWLGIVFLFGAICGPVVLLTFDISKSPVIGGIVGVPGALLIVSLIARIAPAGNGDSPHVYNKVLLASSFLVLLLGAFNQLSHSSRHQIGRLKRGDMQRLAELDRWFVAYATEHNWRDPVISFDVISAWFTGDAITASGYEQTRELVNFQPGLGATGIMGEDRQRALSLLARSDFVVLTTLPKAGLYPFYQKISEFWQDLKDWADKNLIVAQTVPFETFTVTVYVRPSVKVLNLSGNWITSRGITILADRRDLERFPQIRLSGPARFSWLPKIPTVTATVKTQTGSVTLSSSLRVLDQSYEILIDTSSIKDLSSDPVQVMLSCDTFFVPKKLGINADERELVLPAPERAHLLREP
jgi:hypothetical protein